MIKNDGDVFYSTYETAKILGKSTSFVLRHFDNGDLYGELSRGGFRRINYKSIESYLNKPIEKPIMHSRTIDRTGQRFGTLTVKKYIGRKYINGNRYTIWLCKCDCGNEIEVRGSSLLEVKSCGCVAPNLGLPPGESAFNSLYATYERSSRNRNIEFLISKDEFRKLINGDCYYCGRKPYSTHLGKKKNRGSLKCGILYNGIDRMDNSIGYIIENCVSCCKQCNSAKSTMTVKEFINMCNLVSNNWMETFSERQE